MHSRGIKPTAVIRPLGYNQTVTVALRRLISSSAKEKRA